MIAFRPLINAEDGGKCYCRKKKNRCQRPARLAPIRCGGYLSGSSIASVNKQGVKAAGLLHEESRIFSPAAAKNRKDSCRISGTDGRFGTAIRKICLARFPLIIVALSLSDKNYDGVEFDHRRRPDRSGGLGANVGGRLWLRYFDCQSAP